MARESQLWTSLAVAKIRLRERLHMNRVENWATPGTPDVEGFLEGMGFFQYELKSSMRPMKGGPVRFDFRKREKQIEYMRRRWTIGGACFFLLQVGHGHGRWIYLVPGDQGEALKSGVTEDVVMELDLLKNAKFDPVETIKRSHRRC